MPCRRISGSCAKKSNVSPGNRQEMELIMKNRYLPLSLIAAAVLVGCSTVPPQNSSLEDARSLYNSARTDSQVVSLAPLELQKAGDSLSKADAALNKGDNDAVEQQAYLTRQHVAIAQETAKRKSAETDIANATAQRDQVRLEARTAEAEAARRQAAIAQQSADEKAAALAAASAEAQRNAARIAEQEQQLRELEAKKTERGMVITLGDVLFAVNKAQLSAGGMRNVQKLADFLNRYPQRKVLIEGHTDSTGSRSINQPLSEQRADAVRSALVGMGISGNRIETRGYADTYPVATNNTAAGRQLNRRVEIILSDDSGNIVPR